MPLYSHIITSNIRLTAQKLSDYLVDCWPGHLWAGVEMSMSMATSRTICWFTRFGVPTSCLIDKDQ